MGVHTSFHTRDVKPPGYIVLSIILVPHSNGTVQRCPTDFAEEANKTLLWWRKRQPPLILSYLHSKVWRRNKNGNESRVQELLHCKKGRRYCKCISELGHPLFKNEWKRTEASWWGDTEAVDMYRMSFFAGSSAKVERSEWYLCLTRHVSVNVIL